MRYRTGPRAGARYAEDVAELLGRMQGELASQEEEVRKEKAAKWKEKLKASFEKGSSLVFRLIREDQVPGPLEATGKAGQVNVAVQTHLEEQVKVWAGIWQAEEVECDEFGVSKFIAVQKAPEVFSAEQIREVALGFKEATTHLGGWHPRQIGHLGEVARRTLGKIWQVFEWCQVWCRDEEQVLVRMLEKASGGHRPIMLFRTLYRIFGKLRCGSVREWMYNMAARFPQINMAPKRGVGDSTYRLQTRRDLALLEEDEGGSTHVLLNSSGTCPKRSIMSAGSTWRSRQGPGVTPCRHGPQVGQPTGGAVGSWLIK